jgi:hypothetical protein
MEVTMYSRFYAHPATGPASQPDRRPARIEPERIRIWTRARRTGRIKCGGGYRIIRKRLPSS